MKKWLYILLIIDIIGMIIGCIAALLSSFIIGIIYIPLCIISILPLIAIITNIENIENLQYEVNRLKYRIKELEDGNKEITDNNDSVIFKNHEYKETARGTWECVKCGTVNKAGTDTCQNCKASYSPFINPTTDPYEKKKVSRWIKEKKK